jgi:hypothetical protein
MQLVIYEIALLISADIDVGRLGPAKFTFKRI